MKKKKNFLKKTYDSPWRPGHSVKKRRKNGLAHWKCILMTGYDRKTAFSLSINEVFIPEDAYIYISVL